MSSLFYLTFSKLKGTVRNQFRSITSGLVTIFMVLLYGAMVVMVFVSSSTYKPESMGMNANLALMSGIGMAALFMLTVMLNSRKALVYDTDAHYLFAGPYTRAQINFYIMGQSMLQGLLYGLLGCFVMAMFSIDGYFSVPYFLITLLVLWLVLFFFLLLADYIYMWSLVDRKHRKWNYIVAAVFCVLTAAVFLVSAHRTGYDMKAGLLDFILSREFCYVPFFGWAKWALNAFLEREYLPVLLGTGLLLAADVLMVVFFLRFQKDIAEQAVADAEAVSEYVRRVKANGGMAQSSDRKIKRVKGDFPEGARAVFFKNLLIMRKTGNFLRKQDMLILVIYFAISYVVMPQGRFYMFCYMMLLWLFNLLNDAELLGDLKNYQIYLIPEKPLSKLVYAILPAYIKVAVIISVSVIFAGIFNRMDFLSILQYLIMLLGYGMIFIAGNVLSVRMLKARSNVMLENLLRMLLIVACAVPATVIGVLCYFFFQDLQTAMIVVSVITLAMNFVISALVIVACQGMMNGREL